MYKFIITTRSITEIVLRVEYLNMIRIFVNSGLKH